MTEILTSNKLIKISKVGLMLLTCMLVTSWQPEIIFANESNSTETEQVVNKNVSFSEVVPYSQFLNYQYLGDGSEFSSQDIIMEYTPDANGIFQVAAFTEAKAVAYVYQIRSSGLYELAFYDNYNVVQDLRYSELANDGNESLILSSDLSVGSSFYSGYQNEKVRTVVDVIDYYVSGNTPYENVVIVSESQHVNGQAIQLNYYIAPNYGIVSVERTYGDGSVARILELVDTQGFLN
ncbi:hypothetical protein GIY09_06450 [Aerococcaceae bacterium WS4759]|uniref:Uncharacterized protein n=1 Tax=Fundicoccus ignavus TaxID=2664442 RepID=A0A6I2GCI4_9LACT|nr:hypothetical protein [Fundicoccus ignavus]MRI85517.1 hypothetical protein [Fundicoccus ignavus]